LKRVGYNPRALLNMLGEMDKRLAPGGLDFAKTHPDPQERIQATEPLVADSPSVAEPESRSYRFKQALSGIF
jgi:predicted Zn-dependent protease